MYRIIVAALALCLCACATTLTHREGINPPSFETTYRIGERQVVNVGDFMTSTAQFAVKPGFNSPRTVVGRVDHRGRNWEFTAPAGAYVLGGESPAGSFYTSTEGLRSNTDQAYGGLFVPAGTNTATAVAFAWYPWAVLGDDFLLYEAPIDQPLEIPAIETVLVPMSEGVLSTLSYAGVSSGQIRFVYKEFTGDGLARPAFTQEVAFDYSPAETYGYKNARFVVHEASTVEIDFTLLSHL